jgi:hypothetical protein
MANLIHQLRMACCVLLLNEGERVMKLFYPSGIPIDEPLNTSFSRGCTQFIPIFAMLKKERATGTINQNAGAGVPRLLKIYLKGIQKQFRINPQISKTG